MQHLLVYLMKEEKTKRLQLYKNKFLKTLFRLEVSMSNFFEFSIIWWLPTTINKVRQIPFDVYL